MKCILYQIFGFFIETPEGISPVTHIVRKNLSSAMVETYNGNWLSCSQNHWIKTSDRGFVFVKDLNANDELETSTGTTKIKSLILNNEKRDFFDITVQTPSSSFYTEDGLCHHNTRQNANC